MSLLVLLAPAKSVSRRDPLKIWQTNERPRFLPFLWPQIYSENLGKVCFYFHDPYDWINSLIWGKRLPSQSDDLRKVWEAKHRGRKELAVRKVFCLWYSFRYLISIILVIIFFSIPFFLFKSTRVMNLFTSHLFIWDIQKILLSFLFINNRT